MAVGKRQDVHFDNEGGLMNGKHLSPWRDRNRRQEACMGEAACDWARPAWPPVRRWAGKGPGAAEDGDGLNMQIHS